MAGDREACTAAGMNDFIAKPVRQEELRTCLVRWLPAKQDVIAGHASHHGRGQPGTGQTFAPSIPQRPKNNRGVLTAKAEIVAQHRLDPGFTGDIGHVIQIAVRVRLFEVDGRRDHLGLDRLDRDHRLDAAGGAKQVSRHRLG
ncbi:MAG: hypothetical protein EXS37_05645 [Opitutus sp.]|nr:hypothetical protein [Opitutus sp.]